MTEDKTAVVVVASYRSVSKNPFCFKALTKTKAVVLVILNERNLQAICFATDVVILGRCVPDFQDKLGFSSSRLGGKRVKMFKEVDLT